MVVGLLSWKRGILPLLIQTAFSLILPFRFPYPQNQYLYNEANVTTAATGIQDYVWGKQMWWDTRTGVN